MLFFLVVFIVIHFIFFFIRHEQQPKAHHELQENANKKCNRFSRTIQTITGKISSYHLKIHNGHPLGAATSS